MTNKPEQSKEEYTAKSFLGFPPSWRVYTSKEVEQLLEEYAQQSREQQWVRVETLLKLIRWTVDNVWFDNDEYFIKGCGYTSYSIEDCLDSFFLENGIEKPPAPPKEIK